MQLVIAPLSTGVREYKIKQTTMIVFHSEKGHLLMAQYLIVQWAENDIVRLFWYNQYNSLRYPSQWRVML